MIDAVLCIDCGGVHPVAGPCPRDEDPGEPAETERLVDEARSAAAGSDDVRKDMALRALVAHCRQQSAELAEEKARAVTVAAKQHRAIEEATASLATERAARERAERALKAGGTCDDITEPIIAAARRDPVNFFDTLADRARQLHAQREGATKRAERAERGWEETAAQLKAADEAGQRDSDLRDEAEQQRDALKARAEAAERVASEERTRRLGVVEAARTYFEKGEQDDYRRLLVGLLGYEDGEPDVVVMEQAAYERLSAAERVALGLSEAAQKYRDACVVYHNTIDADGICVEDEEIPRAMHRAAVALDGALTDVSGTAARLIAEAEQRGAERAYDTVLAALTASPEHCRPLPRMDVMHALAALTDRDAWKARAEAAERERDAVLLQLDEGPGNDEFNRLTASLAQTRAEVERLREVLAEVQAHHRDDADLDCGACPTITAALASASGSSPVEEQPATCGACSFRRAYHTSDRRCGHVAANARALPYVHSYPALPPDVTPPDWCPLGQRGDGGEP